MDTLKAIQVFVEITQQGSLTKAADKLGMSRAMVSRYLEYLENRFGTRLMQRNTRRVSLTQAGEEALNYCQTMLEQEQLLSNLNAQTHTSGVVRVTAGNFLTRAYLYDAIIAFKQVLPDVQFDVVSQESTLDLIANNIDVALRVTSKIPDGFEGRNLGALGMCLVASPEYLAASSELTHPHQLKKHQCLMHSQASWQSWQLTNEQGQTRSYPVHNSFYCNDVYGLLDMVLRHQGITMMPTAMVAEDVAQGRLLRVLPDYHVTPFHIAVMSPSQSHIPLMVQKFIEFLPTFFAAHPRPLA